MSTLLIDGPSGALEALLALPAAGGTDPQRLWILCHPHPRYGGSMHDGVLATAASAIEAAGQASVRFNFRGVGASAGSFDQGVGECADLEAVAGWVRHRYPQATLGVAGYSFGAFVAWQSGDRLGPLAALCLIAPPTAMMPFSAAAAGCPVTAIYGSEDEFVDPVALNRLTKVRQRVIEGADHFFSAHAEALAAALAATLQDRD